MPIYKDKRTGRWRFDFDRRIRGGRVRRRVLLPAGWTRRGACHAAAHGEVADADHGGV